MVQLSVCPKSERSNQLNVRKPNTTSLNVRSFRFWRNSDFGRLVFGIPLYFKFFGNFWTKFRIWYFQVLLLSGSAVLSSTS